MLNYTRKYFIIFLFILPYCLLTFFFFKPYTFYKSRKQIKEYKVQIQNLKSPSLATSAKKVLERIKTLGLKVEPSSIRHFVHENSIHKIDKEHKQIAWNTSVVLNQILECSKGSAHPPHLSCGPRALALKAIYDVCGISNRLVHIYSDSLEEINSHTFLEVYSPQKNEWTIQDPDFDISYISAITKEAVSTLQITLSPKDDAQPISFDSYQVGWEACGVKSLKDYFFKAVKIDSNEGATVIINEDKFNTIKKFKKNSSINFEEFCIQNYSPCHIISTKSID